MERKVEFNDIISYQEYKPYVENNIEINNNIIINNKQENIINTEINISQDINFCINLWIKNLITYIGRYQFKTEQSILNRSIEEEESIDILKELVILPIKNLNNNEIDSNIIIETIKLEKEELTKRINILNTILEETTNNLSKTYTNRSIFKKIYYGMIDFKIKIFKIKQLSTTITYILETVSKDCNINIMVLFDNVFQYYNRLSLRQLDNLRDIIRQKNSRNLDIEIEQYDKVKKPRIQIEE